MVSAGMQIAGFCLALIGWVLAIVTTFMDSWGKNDLSVPCLVWQYSHRVTKKSASLLVQLGKALGKILQPSSASLFDQEKNQPIPDSQTPQNVGIADALDKTFVTSGLWTQCSTRTNGKRNCEDYVTFFLGLPASLQGARACACVSIALGLIGAILGTFGMECTTIAADNVKLKARMVLISGFLYVIAGATIGAAVSWFASDILHEYYKIHSGRIQTFSTFSQRLVYGPALFVGWTSMVLNLIAGLVLCCSSWSVEEEDRGHTFTYNPPRSKAAEYI